MVASEARHNQSRALTQLSARMPVLTGVLLLAGCLWLAPYAVTAQQQPANLKLSGHVNYARTSPPTSGVKLLEDIFLRVRSTPQIAMARNLMKQQLAMEPPAEQKKGETDYRYAIRPKALAGKATPSPSLQIVANARTAGMEQSLSAAFGGATASGIAGGGGGSGMTVASSRPESVPEVLLGSRQFPLLAQNSPAQGAFMNGAPSSGRIGQQGMWEAQQQAMPQSAAESKADRSRAYQPPDLATATGRFFGIANSLQNAQNYGEQMEKAKQIAVNNELHRRSQQRTDEIAYKGADTFSSADDGDSAGDMLKDMRMRDKESSNLRNRGFYAPNSNLAPSAPPPPAAAPANKKAKLHQVKEEADRAPRREAADRKNVIAMGDIALLPPNVVTGIPLVRLGSSETQASNALQAIGQMKQSKVAGKSTNWTVWTWSRPQAKNGAALQLYVRNGLLDAMRIFDSGLIGPDFGVTLGDSLGRVKEKFGEPAFILQEPGPGAGQNYVYPISQVGFQLARPAPGEQPRVVSVLIFNVK